MLPNDVFRGIPIVDFRLEDEPLSDSPDEETLDFPPARFDPFTGRLGIEMLPGIFSSPVSGYIHDRTRRVVLTADVYDPAIPDREMWELYLRFRRLSTLAHEVGHHAHFSSLQYTDQVGVTAKEQHAETQAYEWTDQRVIPYLRAEYNDTVKLLED